MSADAAQYGIYEFGSIMMEMDCATDDVADSRVGRLLEVSRSSASSGATLCPGPRSYNMKIMSFNTISFWASSRAKRLEAGPFQRPSSVIPAGVAIAMMFFMSSATIVCVCWVAKKSISRE